jgi:hypothetical protein
VLGVVWFFVTYVIRFCINLLIEPQINPIKHFPVVTVSHKLLLPLIPSLAYVLENTGPWTMDRGMSYAVATTIIGSIPGIFGFLVWELKENWRLYAANRSPTLKPEVIGSHGETMLRLLRPGFHSGTVPKLRAKLRRAERRGRKRTARKIRATLHHVEEGVRYFVEREFLELLARSKGWAGLALTLQEVCLGTNRIAIELRCPGAPESLRINFDHHEGWLIAGVAEAGWLTKLSRRQRQTLASALAGLYKLAGIGLTREQVEAAFAPKHFPYALTSEGLVVWSDDTFEASAVYDLDEESLTPCPALEALPVLEPAQLLFDKVPIAWQQWVEVWRRDQDGEELPEAFLDRLHLLPG